MGKAIHYQKVGKPISTPRLYKYSKTWKTLIATIRFDHKLAAGGPVAVRWNNRPTREDVNIPYYAYGYTVGESFMYCGHRYIHVREEKTGVITRLPTQALVQV